ncbi:metallophosphoesterase [[Clostridium] spiroforme]|nr:metallophosphoesterase [Thomasclavelia spiroformis]
MLEIGASFSLFILYFVFYHWILKRIIDHKVICLLVSLVFALPVSNMESAMFIFEIYFAGIYLLFYLISHQLSFLAVSRKLMSVMIVLSLLISSLAVIYGEKNMKNIQQTVYDVYTDKALSKDYSLVMISDLHYPATMNASKLKQLVKRISHDAPDLIVLCGDIVDEHTDKKEIKEVFAILGSLSKQSQLYYVFGNHDTGNYACHHEITFDWLKTVIEKQHITVLVDESICFHQEIMLTGRLDVSFAQRKPLEQVLLSEDNNHYQIVLDHRPEELSENALYDVDLHLSGHTHAGQIFPLYFFYEWLHVNELNYGKKLYQQMTAINSSGAGGWGFPVRTEHHSEYVLVRIHKK